MSDYNDIPTVTQPPNLQINLFRHQLASIYRMETLERDKLVEYDLGIKETYLGVNADPTGFGKTCSMVGLILRDKMEWDLEVPFVQEVITTEAAGLVRNREIKRYDRLPATLVLVSPSIVSQWEKELSYTNLRVEVVSNKRDVDKINVDNCDVVIVTVSMFNNLIMSYAKYAWKRFIFDEPGHVRVSGMKELKAGFYWFVTATPEAITSYHRNCRGSFMKKIMGDGWTKFEEQFQPMIIRNDIDFVRTSFEMPITVHHEHKCYQPILRAISGMVNDNIQTMLSAGNIEGVITALGGKKTKNIIDLVKQEKLEQQTKIEADIYIYRNIKKDDDKLRQALEEFKSISLQLEQLQQRFEQMLRENCSVCMTKLKKPVLEPNCQNLFCGECLLVWLQQARTCPLCRISLQPNDLVYIKNEENNIDYLDTKPVEKMYTQLEKVIEIVSNNKQGKFIIFSGFDSTFGPICRILTENGISFTEVKGSRKTRQKSIENFKYGNVQVIFLNSNFNGAGINLQEATDIILYHEMSSTTENQIIGRANRIGRTQPLQVHHLINTN